MWNRVVLLTCGMAFGWSLANYWVAPRGELAKHQYRLAVSAVIGLSLAAWLAWETFGAGLMALAILLLCAVVTYAGNARQLGKPVEPDYPQPETPGHKTQTPAVLLVAHAEPRRYRGPSPWCERMRAEEALERQSPHWFVRPYSCYRIKRAYAEMPEGPPSYRALSELAERVQDRLGGHAVVRHVLMWGTPGVADALHSLAELGHSRLLVLPVDLGADHVLDLRQAIVHSRVREAGPDVSVLPEFSAGLWQPESVSTRLGRLMGGKPLEETIQVEASLIDAVCSVIEERL
jgi:hypothetical protein